MKPEITILVGPPASGKTSLAKAIVDTNRISFTDKSIVFVDQDLHGKEGHLNRFHTAIKHLDDIVVSRMNFNKEQRERYLKPAREAGYTTKIVVLHETRETCMKRCLNRNDHPTIITKEDASKAINFFFKSYERPTQDEADVVEYKYPDNKLEANVVIVDLDSTLCNIDHRLHFMKGEKKDWKGFFDGIKDDTLNKWCKDIIRGVRDNNVIVLCSGRPDNYREATVNWLRENRVPYDHLFMRERNDYRRDDVIKENILDLEVLSRYNSVNFAIDDRKQVVDLWRKRGIVTLQCAEGNF